MGNLCGGNIETEDQRKSGAKVDQILKDDKTNFENTVRALLLGAGESGKSTIFKQLRIILQDGFSPEECLQYKDAVYANSLSGMKSLVIACQKFGLALAQENEEKAKEIAQINDSILLTAGKVWTNSLGDHIKHLWQDPAIKKAFDKRNEFQIGDSAEYYFNNIERISTLEYIPTTQDVLRTRVKTTGIVETNFKVDGRIITMIDVGGQRNERKKWIHCFEGVSAVLYVSSLSEYDQKCYEDDKTNRMIESLALFEETCNSKWFTATSIILFLNKVDIFKQKIQTSDLSVIFPDYTGGLNYEKAAEFIVKQFEQRNKESNRHMHVHFTCATDTDELKKVWTNVKSALLSTKKNESTPV